jgi:hypothetical protein
MADSQTALLPDGTNRLTKPEIGGSRDTWGNKTNANWDYVASNLSLVNTTATAALPKSGGTSTGKQIFDAGIRLTHVTANPTPVGNGDLWTTTGGIFAYINGVTRQVIDSTGGTLTNFLTLHAAPTSDLHASTKKYVDDRVGDHTHAVSKLTQSGATTGQVITWNGTQWVPQTATGGTASGVTSFNTRTGDVTLSSLDVLGALGYSPFSNAGGAISGETRIGTTSAIGGLERLSVVATTGQSVLALRTVSNSANLIAGYNAATDLVFNVNGLGAITARKINAGSSTGFTAANAAFTNTNDWALEAWTTNGPALAVRTDINGLPFVSFFYNGSIAIGGIINNATSVAYNTSSDYRLKDNVADYTSGVALIKQLRPVTFRWKADPSAPSTIGFIAHEVQAVLPQAVTGQKDAVDKDGNILPQGIDQSKIVPALTAAVKELEARVVALEAK